MNIVTSFIPNETITFDYQDLPWMNSFIKKLICAKENFYNKVVHKSNNMYHLCAFKNLRNHFNQSIQVAKQNYVNKITQKLGDPNTSNKRCWSLLKTLLNRKKIPCTPPLLHCNNYVVGFEKLPSVFRWKHFTF